jgi:hypothetical protein
MEIRAVKCIQGPEYFSGTLFVLILCLRRNGSWRSRGLEEAEEVRGDIGKGEWTQV